MLKFFFQLGNDIQVAVESPPHWPATSKDTPRAAGRWACTLLSNSSVGLLKAEGHVGQGNTSYKPPDFFGGGFSSIHISFLGFGGDFVCQLFCMILYVWCVCFSQRFALRNVFWFLLFGNIHWTTWMFHPMDLFCRQLWRLRKLPNYPENLAKNEARPTLY